MAGNSDEREWKTRKKRIDPRLDGLGWKQPASGTTAVHGHRTEEEETDNGPADYALWLNKDLVGIVEAKKVTVGPQNVLTQAERYSRGARSTKFAFGGYLRARSSTRPTARSSGSTTCATR
jgi:type I restriction enzyme R subunit